MKFEHRSQSAIKIFIIMSTILITLSKCWLIDEPPARPPNVPADAVWVGGYDGGVWVKCIDCNESTSMVQCDIFTDVTGVTEVSGYFVYKGKEHLKCENLNQQFNAFTGDSIVLLNYDVLQLDKSP